MNTASQNLPHHLGVLRDKLQHPTDYELAMSYFLEEFAGDLGFLNQSEPRAMPSLLAIVTKVAAQALGKAAVRLQQPRVLGLPGHQFFHGNGVAEGRVVLFFYFEDANVGLLALIPGTTGGMQLGRFHVPAGLANPERN